MDAHSTVTAEEGDRYPLVPPSFAVMEGQAPGNERPILVVRRGSSPLTAPSFVKVSARECHAS